MKHSYPTSFGKKYDHFSLLCKQMVIIEEKCTLLGRLAQRPHFWPNPILVCCLRDVYRTRQVLKIDF